MQRVEFVKNLHQPRPVLGCILDQVRPTEHLIQSGFQLACTGIHTAGLEVAN